VSVVEGIMFLSVYESVCAKGCYYNILKSIGRILTKLAALIHLETEVNAKDFGVKSSGVARNLRQGVCKVVLPLPSPPLPFPFPSLFPSIPLPLPFPSSLPLPPLPFRIKPLKYS